MAHPPWSFGPPQTKFGAGEFLSLGVIIWKWVSWNFVVLWFLQLSVWARTVKSCACKSHRDQIEPEQQPARVSVVSLPARCNKTPNHALRLPTMVHHHATSNYLFLSIIRLPLSLFSLSFVFLYISRVMWWKYSNILTHSFFLIVNSFTRV